MRTLRERLDPSGETAATLTLTLTYDQRRRSRQRARLGDGSEIALVLPRGLVLQDGDRLGGDGLTARVVAAAEQVSTARTDDARLLARACYHLGNRHVAVEVGDGYARYQHDHVLDHMVASLGLRVSVETVAFEPESGAYGGHGHGGHGHGAHEHRDDHGAHDHDHATHDHATHDHATHSHEHGAHHDGPHEHGARAHDHGDDPR